MLKLILFKAYERLTRQLYERIITNPTFKINQIRVVFFATQFQQVSQNT